MTSSAINNALDCSVATGGTTGCSAGSSSANDYGDNFNANHGGAYVMQWTSQFIKIWFFSRNNIPQCIKDGHPDVTQFGKPQVMFSGAQCDIDSHFKEHRLVFDTDFCGSWGGAVYQYFPQCPSAAQGWAGCVDYVGKNPQAFVEA